MSKATLNRLLNDFYPYAKEYLGFDKDADVYFVSDVDNANKPLGKTAHYDPAKREISVYTDNRHTKDIMRSVSHELVHHAQNCRGDLGMSEDTGQGYAQNDEHLREMEREAYEKGNLCFRDWEDGIKSNLQPGTIYESRTQRSKNRMPNFRTLNEGFKSFLIESDYQRGDEVEIVGSVNAGAKGIIQEPMAGHAVVELTEVPADSKYGKEGDLIKVKDEYIEKPGYMSGGTGEESIEEADADGDVLQKAQAIFPEGHVDIEEDGFGGYEVLLHPDSITALESDPAVQAQVSDAFGKQWVSWEMTNDGFTVEATATEPMQEDAGDDVIQKALAIFPEAEVHEDGFGGYEILLNPESLEALESDPAVQGQVSDAFGDTWEMTEDGIAVDGGEEAMMQEITKMLGEYGDHETQARGGEVASSYSANPEMDQIEDIGKTVAEQGGGIEEIAAALSAEGFRVSAQGRTFYIDGRYVIGSPKDIGQDDQTHVLSTEGRGVVLTTLHGTGVTEGFRDSPEEKEMTSKMSNKEFSDYHTRDKHLAPDLKGDMGPLPGMEGPFQFKSGAVLYYDNKAGKYYDRGKDMHLDNEEAAMLTMENKKMNLKETVVASVMAALKEGNFAEYGAIDAEDGNPPSKIGQGDEAYMAAYNAVLVARGEEPLPIVQPDQKYLDALQSGGMKPSDHSYNKKGVQEMYHDDDPYAEDDPYMAGLEAEFPWLADKKKGAAPASPEEEAAAAAAAADAAAAGEFAVPGEEDEDERPTVMKEEGEWTPPRSRDDIKYGGQIHLIPDVQFSGDITADIQGLPKEILNWMWGELESADSIEDEFGRNYAGGDVQDAVGELPDELFEKNKNGETKTMRLKTNIFEDENAFTETLRGRVMKRLQTLQEKEAESSEKHDDDPALKGDQDELPDKLQKNIIDSEDEEKNESLRERVRRIVQETLGGGITAEEFAAKYNLQVEVDDNGQEVIYVDSEQIEQIDFEGTPEAWDVQGLDGGEYAIYTGEHDDSEGFYQEGAKYKREFSDEEKAGDPSFDRKQTAEELEAIFPWLAGMELDALAAQVVASKEGGGAEAGSSEEESEAAGYLKREGKQPPWLKKDKEDDDTGEEEEEKNESEEAEGEDPEADEEDKEKQEENIAANPEDFYRKLRNESRTVVKEDWTRSSKSKRSAMLNERLMKSWFNK